MCELVCPVCGYKLKEVIRFKDSVYICDSDHSCSLKVWTLNELSLAKAILMNAIEEGRKEGYNEGYADGFKSGSL